MLKISRLTDYGTVVLAELACHQDALASATELANLTRINLPTVSKILKILNKANLIDSVIESSSNIKGGVKDVFKIFISEASISTSPVGKFLFIVPSGKFLSKLILPLNLVIFFYY